MSSIKMYQVDAFTDSLFGGNPAAVCPLDKWLADDTMQAIAAENNLAETSFVVEQEDGYAIRWFTPTIEVDLCGHATLATGYVLFNIMGQQGEEIAFHSMNSGVLKVFREGPNLFLDFPTDQMEAVDPPSNIKQCIGVNPSEVYRGKTDLLVLLQDEDEVRAVQPNFLEIAKLPARGLIITSRGKRCDFVSRFFAPQSGVDEDSVTGSAHTSLTPLWAQKLDRNNMTAQQLSGRKGNLSCRHLGDRCHIGGGAVLYMTGEITVQYP